MIEAFRTCQSECLSIQRAIDSARDRLRAHWQSDQAAPAFWDALDQWQGGFQRVQRGLDMLDEQMREYAHLTTSAEDTNASHARRSTTS